MQPAVAVIASFNGNFQKNRAEDFCNGEKVENHCWLKIFEQNCLKNSDTSSFEKRKGKKQLIIIVPFRTCRERQVIKLRWSIKLYGEDKNKWKKGERFERDQSVENSFSKSQRGVQLPFLSHLRWIRITPVSFLSLAALFLVRSLSLLVLQASRHVSASSRRSPRLPRPSHCRETFIFWFLYIFLGTCPVPEILFSFFFFFIFRGGLMKISKRVNYFSVHRNNYYSSLDILYIFAYRVHVFCIFKFSTNAQKSTVQSNNYDKTPRIVHRASSFKQ